MVEVAVSGAAVRAEPTRFARPLARGGSAARAERAEPHVEREAPFARGAAVCVAAAVRAASAARAAEARAAASALRRRARLAERARLVDGSSLASEDEVSLALHEIARLCRHAARVRNGIARSATAREAPRRRDPRLGPRSAGRARLTLPHDNAAVGTDRTFVGRPGCTHDDGKHAHERSANHARTLGHPETLVNGMHLHPCCI